MRVKDKSGERETACIENARQAKIERELDEREKGRETREKRKCVESERQARTESVEERITL